MQPELLIIADQSPDHPVMLSLVSQLLELGVHFASANESFPRELPDRLDGYKAVLLDTPAFNRLTADSASRDRLEQFVRTGGCVAGLEDPGVPLTDLLHLPLSTRIMIDVVTTNRAHDIVVHGNLSRFSPAHLQARSALSDDDILASLKAFILRNIRTRRGWDEFALHFWKPAKALAEAGHGDVRDALLAAVRESLPNMPTPENHDLIAGLFAAPWYADQTGDRAPLDQVRRVVDEMIQRRPREMDVLCGLGYTDDPLNVRAPRPNPAQPRVATRTSVIWTEVLHFHGPTFSSLFRATGDRRYLDEVMKLVDHISRYHVRPDNIFTHCTRRGQPITAAWSRAQSHALYGLRYMLEELPPDSPEFHRVLDLVARVGRGLQKYQDPSTGLWRNVIDHPDARLETTCTTGIIATYAWCVRRGHLPREEFEPMIRRAWQGLKLMFWRGGLASGCRGTAAGADVSYYLARQHGWSVVPQLVLPLLDLNQM